MVWESGCDQLANAHSSPAGLTQQVPPPRRTAEPGTVVVPGCQQLPDPLDGTLHLQDVTRRDRLREAHRGACPCSPLYPPPPKAC